MNGVLQALQGTSLDPCQRVYDALEQQGWDPQGPAHQCRANCPAHGGDSHQLRVNEGEDGRALLFCHTQHCKAAEIVSALGLTWADLFPPGHRSARDLSLAEPPRLKRRAEKLSEILGLLDEVHEPWQVTVTCKCTFCDEWGAVIVTTQGAPGVRYQDADGKEVDIAPKSGGDLTVTCPNGCSDRAFRQGLMGRVQLARADAVAKAAR